MSEFQNVFAEVFICPETMELLQESLRETHFEATAASFSNILENQQGNKMHPGGIPVGRNGGRGPVGISQLGEGAQLASASWGPAVPGREMDVRAGSCSAILPCQILETALLSHRFVPKG